MHEEAVTTFLFTDIEGSTRLWEEEPERMREALTRHDAAAREAVMSHGGEVVKMTGDGIHAAFTDPLDAVGAALELLHALADPRDTHGIALAVRCGMHAGTYHRRDADFFGTAVNRAARIMSAAHGGQVLLSETVARALDGRLTSQVTLRDLGAVRLRDLGSPERIFQLVQPALRADFPPLRSLEETPNNLPHELTSFVGREREVERAGELLAKGRMLTVTGMGGIGKTRLALQMAADAIGGFPDGVWFVELAALQDPRGVPQAVATVLGVKEEAGKTVTDALLRYVKDRTVLLVLDNCEHLVQACADLARLLLSSSARLRILATSREPLRVAGETTFTLSALSIPDLRAPFEPLALTRSESAQLFIERAIAAQADFLVTQDNSASIAAICHRLDGIPLAIELAAARVRGLSVEKIAERLIDRFRLLKGGDPTTLPRLQTLRSLIDWSYELLSEDERAFLRQLSVFAGGWTLEAAETVCVCGADVVDLLGRLVDKSLVIRDPATQRYWLLSTVRQYAQERLDERGEGEGVRLRHLEFHVSLASSARSGLVGSDQGAWLRRLDQERDNFQSAHAHADIATEGGRLGLELVCGIKQYWMNRGLVELGHRLTLEALSRPGAKQVDLARFRGLFQLGQFRNLAGKYSEARECLEQALTIARAMQDARAIAAVLQPLGLAAFGEGDFPVARSYLEEALALANQRTDPREIIAATCALGQLYRVAGSGQARPLFEQVVAMARDLADSDSVAIGLLNLAMLAVTEADSLCGVERLSEALDIANGLDSRRVGQSVLEVCAGLAAAGGDASFAARLFGASEAHARTTGLSRDPADEAFLAPLIEVAGQSLGKEQFAAAQAQGSAWTYPGAIGACREWLAKRR